MIAFSLIAEDLMERSAYHASHNMEILATEHVITLQKAIGKSRLFHRNGHKLFLKFFYQICPTEVF
jgi:hypothetical protein